MLSGVVYPLRLGWYGIVGRSHEATLQGRVRIENSFLLLLFENLLKNMFFNRTILNYIFFKHCFKTINIIFRISNL